MTSFKKQLKQREARALLLESFKQMLASEENDLQLMYECARMIWQKDFRKLFGKDKLHDVFIGIMKDISGEGIVKVADFAFNVAKPKSFLKRLFNLG